jgi:hypothetical protein
MPTISNSTDTSTSKKTLKRELALGVFGLWTIISVRLAWYTNPELVHSFDSFYSTLTMAMIALVGAAIGMDWVSLQSPWAKKPDV